MNSKTMKKIKRHVPVISVQRLRSLMPNEEEASKITTDNYEQFLNQDKFYFSDRQVFNSSFTEKWTRRKLKKLFKLNPSRSIDSYNYTDLL